MKNTYSLTIVISILLLSHSVIAQKKYEKLKIGDSLPEYIISNLINFNKTYASLKDFKADVVILDFWDKGCISCIEAWPKLQLLKEKFGNKLDIVLYNPLDNQDAVKNIIKRQKELGNVDLMLPTVCGDSTIKQMFPFKTVPHVVWIKNGVIKAITPNHELTDANILNMINGNDPKMTIKDGVKIKVDFEKPLYFDGNGGTNENLIYESSLSQYKPGLYGTAFVKPKVSCISNVDILTMCRYLFKDKTNRFGAQNFFPLSQVELRVKDTTRLIGESHGIVNYKNYYIYQFFSKLPISEEKIFYLMRADTKKYFDIDFYFEKQKKKCMVLKLADSTKIAFKSGEIKSNFFDDGVELNGITVKEFFELVRASTDLQKSKIPIIDETEFTGKMGGIKLPNLSLTKGIEMNNFNKEFSKYGLQIFLEDREIDVLVITDARPYTNIDK